jgi:glycerophosphoryl diester phosphodiesterase
MKIQAVGHRGAAGIAPETTIESFQHAIQLGVDAVEADIHRSRDGVLVAIHDEDVSRTTNGKGLIRDLTLSQLKALDAGSWFNRSFPEKARPEFAGLRIPTLQEVVDTVKESGADLFIETKNPERYQPDLESSLLDLIRRNGMERRVRVLSFSAQSLRRIKALNASISTVLLIAAPDRNLVQESLEISAEEIGILHTRATPAHVAEAHRNGLSISVWTVDEPDDLERVIALGVDGITSNFPDRLVQRLRRE